jgi:hypothetical protein
VKFDQVIVSHKNDFGQIKVLPLKNFSGFFGCGDEGEGGGFADQEEDRVEHQRARDRFGPRKQGKR